MAALEDDVGTETAVVNVPDLEILEDVVDGLPMRMDQLTAGPSNVRMSMVRLPGLTISTGLSEGSIRSSGEVVAGAAVVGVPLSAGAGSWNGVNLRQGRVWCYGPGSEHDGVAARPPWWAGVTIERWLFSGSDQEHLFDGPHLKIIDSSAAAGLADLVRTADSMIDRLAGARAALLRNDVVDAIATLGDDATALTTSAAARLVQRCESLAPDLGPIPTVRELAATVGTSDRWVRSAFSQTYGIAPSDYFRARALASCRRELEAAEPGSITVTDVAVRAGFWHLGRFSARYRQVFGESPSQTLART